jgi:DTW domain-containing protein YfiP
MQAPIKTLIVIDGSWVTAQDMLRRSSALQPRNLRHVHLASW